MKLSKIRFEQAVDFIQIHARPLDIRLHKFYFNQGSAEDVLDELAAYQNDDGGFGHGIESDFRLEASSPMATSVGLQYCVKVNATADQPIVKNAIQYLLATYNAEHRFWPSTYENVNEAPHAFWWHVSDLAPPDEELWPNVSAELVGYIHHYREIVPESFYAEVMTRALENLRSTNTLSPLYNVLCWERTAVLTQPPFQTEIKAKIQRSFAQVQPITQESLKEIRIFWLADGPTAVLAQQYPETVQKLLEQEITHQADDGGWWPGWHWGQYEDVWPIAEREWAGKITVEALHTFRNFGKLEGYDG